MLICMKLAAIYAECRSEAHMLNVVMLGVGMMSIVMLNAIYAECHNYANYAECCYAECSFSVC